MIEIGVARKLGSERDGTGSLLDRLCQAVYAALVRAQWIMEQARDPMDWEDWRDKHLKPWLIHELEASGLNADAHDEDARIVVVAGKMIKEFESQIRADLEELVGDGYRLNLSAYYHGKLDRIRYDLAEIEKIRGAINPTELEASHERDSHCTKG